MYSDTYIIHYRAQFQSISENLSPKAPYKLNPFSESPHIHILVNNDVSKKKISSCRITFRSQFLTVRLFQSECLIWRQIIQKAYQRPSHVWNCDGKHDLQRFSHVLQKCSSIQFGEAESYAFWNNCVQLEWIAAAKIPPV